MGRPQKYKPKTPRITIPLRNPKMHAALVRESKKLGVSITELINTILDKELLG